MVGTITKLNSTLRSPKFILWHIRNVKQKIDDYFKYQQLVRTIDAFVPNAYSRK